MMIKKTPSNQLCGQKNKDLCAHENCLFCLLQVIRKGEVSCCWTCTPCKENEFVFDEYTCRACELGSWPNDGLTGQYI